MYGFNIFFARGDVAERLPTVELDELFRHGSYHRSDGARHGCLALGGRRSASPATIAPVATPDRSLPVAVFDSGVGGLTVLHECLVSLPARGLPLPRRHGAVPVRRPSARRARRVRPRARRDPARPRRQAARRRLQLGDRGGAAAAAGGAGAHRSRGRRRASGVEAGRQRPRQPARSGLIATPATVNSGAYARALAAEAPHAELHAVASAELAPLIQEGGEVDHRTLACVEGACRPLKRAEVDTVILGCTHYPLVRPVLQRELGRRVTIVSSGEAIATEVEAHAARGRSRERRAPPRRLPLPRDRRPGAVPPRRHPLPAAADRRGRARGGQRLRSAA